MPDIFSWIASLSSALPSAENCVKIAQVASPFLVLIGALVAVRAFRVNRSTNWYLKSVDVMLKCNERYDALLATRTELVRRESEGKDIPHKEEIDTYFRRFWGLQVDQLDYYQLGMIERGVFVDWAIHKVKLFRGNEVIGETPFGERFNDIKENVYWEKSDFVEFFGTLQRLSNRNNPQAYEVLSKELNAWLNRKRRAYRKRQRAWFRERR